MKQTLNFVLLFNVKQSLCYNLSVFVPNTDDILYICVIKMTVLSLIKHNHKTQEWLIWKKPFNTGMVQTEFYTAPLHQLSHARTVVRECCKGDDESQWEMGKFDPPPPKNHLTDGHQNLCT